MRDLPQAPGSIRVADQQHNLHYNQGKKEHHPLPEIGNELPQEEKEFFDAVADPENNIIFEKGMGLHAAGQTQKINRNKHCPRIQKGRKDP